MKNRVATLTIMLALAFSGSLYAQSPDSISAVERGNRSFVLELGSTSNIGYWTRRSDRTDLGLDVSLNGILGESSHHFAIGLTPALKRYHRSAGALAAYTYFGVPLKYARTKRDNVGAPDTTDDLYSIGAAVGFGLEWMPVRQVSIGGHVGLGTSYTHDRSGNDGLFRLGTESSGVRVHLYF